jgi:hypothetical protein
LAHTIMMRSKSCLLIPLALPQRNMALSGGSELGVTIFRAVVVAAAAVLAGGAAFAQSAPPSIPSWSATPKAAAGAGVQLSIRGVPGWFRIGVPTGWQLNADRISGRVGVSGAEGRSVRLWLMLLPHPIEADDVGPIFAVTNSQMSSRTVWSQPVMRRNGGRMTIAVQGREGDFTRAAGMSFIPVGQVTVALYTIASARHPAFEPNRDLFAAVLESFMPLPGYVGGRPGLENITFERWNDPNERAFSVDVPKGWRVQGGTVRKVAIDVRHVVQLMAPDQSVLIQFGDGAVPPFVEPAANGPDEETSGPALTMRYRRADQFGRRYLGWRAKPLVRDIAFDRSRLLPDVQQRLQAIQNAYATDDVARTADAADMFFHGTWNGQPAKGYLFVATTRIAQRGGNSLWFAGDFGSLQGFMAAEERIPTAVAVMERMRTSFELVPQWYRDNSRMVEATLRLAAEANRHVSTTIAQTYAHTRPPYGSINERFIHYNHDVVPFRDPQSGRSYRVQVGMNYYWIAERGVIYGAATSFNPDPLWFREMLMVKP